jgi:hypothetical protein
MLDNFCYKQPVGQKFEKKDVVVGTKIPESLKQEIDDIAAQHDRTVSYVLREFLIRGLSLYRVDGQIKGEPVAASDNVVATIGPGSLEETRRLYEQNQAANNAETRAKFGGKLNVKGTNKTDDEEGTERDDSRVSTPRKRAGNR